MERFHFLSFLHTNQILCLEPFAVINCDDFYGRDSFQVMGKFLSALPEGSKNVYSMVGFRIGNTLSESGTVSRGLCGIILIKLVSVYALDFHKLL